MRAWSIPSRSRLPRWAEKIALTTEGRRREALLQYEVLRDALSRELGAEPGARADHERHVAAARAGLGEEAFEAALAQGRAMDPKRAIEYALSREEEERQPPTLVAVSEQQPPGGERTQALTAREQEVALLLARGLTNRRIAQVLSISEHTVANHVGKILKKLKLRSRAQISSS